MGDSRFGFSAYPCCAPGSFLFACAPIFIHPAACDSASAFLLQEPVLINLISDSLHFLFIVFGLMFRCILLFPAVASL